MTQSQANTSAFSLEIDADGIGLVTIDMPGRAMNVLNPTLVVPFAGLVEQLETDNNLKGLVITSAKSTFIVGADIDQLTQITSAEEAFKLCEDLKGMMRRMEKCGKPVVAALNGTALGGGLELALACHARIAIDDPKAKFGLPEVKLGLLPGGGGTQRVPRMIGIQKSFELITQGKELTAAKAKDMGLVTELATTREDMLAKAKAWCKANPKASQPWDNKGFRIPGGDSKSPAVVQVLAIAPSMANAKAHGNYPALTHIMSCLFEGCLLDFDAGSQVESRYFAACVVSQTSKNMIGTLWHQLNAIKKGQSRPKGPAESKVKKVGILGAGMMGAGIAYVSSKVGIDVVLLDTTQENAEKGKAYSQGILDKAISRGRSTAEKRDALLARIKPTTSYEDLQGCDLVIEAVFEDRAIKAETTKKAEAVIPASAVYASNTSTLPITGLAQASSRPQNFIGLHFFSPVDNAPGGDHRRQGNQRRDAGAWLRLRAADRQDAHRGQRQAGLLHLARVHDLHHGRHGHAGRGRAPALHRGRRPEGGHAHAAAGAAGRGVAEPVALHRRDHEEGPGRRRHHPARSPRLCRGAEGGRRAQAHRQEGQPGLLRLRRQGKEPVARPAGGVPAQGRSAFAAGDRGPPALRPGQRSRALL
jgi:3-hydroxyacyl-CoA dehydrogenase/enoyl-CoA hydratase/3-hydroxybutyryl-CoA epimerase